MTEKHIKSEKKMTYRVIYFIGIIGSVLLSKSCYAKFNPNNYSDASYLIGIVFFLLFAIICLYGLICVKDYYVFNTKIIFKSFLGIKSTTVNLEEIQSWTEIQKKDKYNSWEILSLFTNTGTEIKISSYYYVNYYEIKTKIVKNKTRNLKIEEYKLYKENKNYAIGFIVIGAIFLFCAYKFVQIKDVKSSDIIVFGDITSKNIELIKGRKNSNKVIIKIEKYPDFNFQISGTTLKETYAEDLINDVKDGDSIYLGINKTEFRKKIIKIDSLTLIDKYFHYEIIHIESIKTSKFEYLKLTENNNGRKSNKYWGFSFFGIVGLFLFMSGIYMFKEYYEKKTPTNTRYNGFGQ